MPVPIKPFWRNPHLGKENNVDPDDGNSMLCSVCNVPIFFTPYITTNAGNDEGTQLVFLHDQCANLPKELKDCSLHPQKPLLLRENENHLHSRQDCYECYRECGTKLYYCPDSDCGFKLDVLCALTIKILHRCHLHRLTVISGGGSQYLTCYACGTQHYPYSCLGPSYFCDVCSVWIHRDCASLPNAIEHRRHEHPLLLNYHSDAQSYLNYWNVTCAICADEITSVGVYSCIKCAYHVHIKCVGLDAQSFKSVLIREAQFPDLVRLPIPDEYKSLIHYASSSTSEHHDGDEPPTDLHEHPLIFHNHDDDDIIIRVCDACVKFISPPFYSCSECPDFFLHNCCAHLPRTLTRPRTFPELSPLSLIPNKSIINEISCFFCPYEISSGFFYSTTDDNINLHIPCALMPESITHDAHGKSHIIYLSYHSVYRNPTGRKCNCCGRSAEWFVYDCRTCRDFILHTWCALLPDTVGHKFDKHPLKLITSCSDDDDKEEIIFCEVCEGIIDKKVWYYSCNECQQSFHINCIPCLDDLSMIKFGSTIQVECHGCPLLLVRGLTLRGYRCDCCGRTFKIHDMLAFECSKCCFWIDSECAEKNFRPSLREQLLWWRKPKLLQSLEWLR